LKLFRFDTANKTFLRSGADPRIFVSNYDFDTGVSDTHLAQYGIGHGVRGSSNFFRHTKSG